MSVRALGYLDCAALELVTALFDDDGGIHGNVIGERGDGAIGPG